MDNEYKVLFPFDKLTKESDNAFQEMKNIMYFPRTNPIIEINDINNSIIDIAGNPPLVLKSNVFMPLYPPFAGVAAKQLVILARGVPESLFYPTILFPCLSLQHAFRLV